MKTKHISVLTALLLALFAGLTFTSCDDDDDDSTNIRETIIGTWEVYHVAGHDSDNEVWDNDVSIYDETSLFEFRPDGTGLETAYYKGMIDYTEPFVYRISGRQIIISYENLKIIGQIISITPFELIMHYTNDTGFYYVDETLYMKATLY